MDFPQILRQLMIEKNVTSYRIGKDTGISNRLIDYWKKGEKLPGAENLQKIASYFNVTTDYLLGNSPYKTAPEQYSNMDENLFSKTVDAVTKLNTKTQKSEPDINNYKELGKFDGQLIKYKSKEKKPTLEPEDELDPLDKQLLNFISTLTDDQKILLLAQLQLMNQGKKEYPSSPDR